MTQLSMGMSRVHGQPSAHGCSRSSVVEGWAWRTGKGCPVGVGCRRAATTKMAVFPSYLLCRVGIFFNRCELFTPRGKPLKRLPFSCDRRGHPLRVSCANRRGGAWSFWGAHGVLAGTGAHPRAVWQAEGRSWGVSTKARCRRPLSSPHPESGPPVRWGLPHEAASGRSVCCVGPYALAVLCVAGWSYWAVPPPRDVYIDAP